MLKKSNDEFYLSAIKLADIASQISTKYFRTNIDIENKLNHTPVTIADREIELALRNWIEIHYPNHNIMGEEYNDVINNDNNNSNYTWVIDPIDGTVAFSSGKPLFTTLIALLHGNSPVIGIIDQPVLNDRFVGISKYGAWLNGVKLKTSLVNNVEQARFNVTTPYMFKTEYEKQIFEKLQKHVLLTSFGGDAYSYGLLAAGHIDVILESDLGYYDIAALQVIIEESGGVFTNWQGEKINKDNFNQQVLATANRELHQQILSIINQ